MERWNGGLSSLKASQIREFYPWHHSLWNDTELSPTRNPSLSSGGTPWAWHSLACRAPANHGNVMGGCCSSKPTPGRGGKLNGLPPWKQQINFKKLNENSLEMQFELLSELLQTLSEVSHWRFCSLWRKKKRKNERKQTLKCSRPKMNLF